MTRSIRITVVSTSHKRLLPTSVPFKQILADLIEPDDNKAYGCSWDDYEFDHELSLFQLGIPAKQDIFCL